MPNDFPTGCHIDRKLEKSEEREEESIKALRAENEVLKKELRRIRENAFSTITDEHKRIQELFEENTLKQFEIEELKRRLEVYETDQKQRHEPEQSRSSPLRGRPSSKFLSTRKRSAQESGINLDTEKTEGNFQRVKFKDPQQKLSMTTNVHEHAIDTLRRVKSLRTRKNPSKAIAIIAEDGQSYDTALNAENSDVKGSEEQRPNDGRLRSLLSGTIPGKPILSGLRTRGKGRSKSVGRLSLNDFRRNPKLIGGSDGYANDFDRERAALKCLPGCSKTKCCSDHLRVLMQETSISPHIVETLGPLSDHELLLRFIGDGAEEKLKEMTSIARENLLQEARTRYIAEALALRGKEIDRSEGAPGLWSVDMASTQEHEDNREQAHRFIQDEIQRRYESACQGNGEWVFADEINEM